MVSASEAEVRKLFRKLEIIGAFAFILATVITFGIFYGRTRVPSSFLSDLVNLNAILVAAMAFLVPHVFQAAKLIDFVDALEISY